MKKIIVALCLLALSLTAWAQSSAPVPAGKAVVYFVRPNTLGALINFNFYDGDNLIARFNGGKYFRYECAPGEHVFWARSENRSFVEAELLAGEIYVIEAVPAMGGLKAQVMLMPVDPRAKGLTKPTQKMVAKRASETYTTEELAKWSENTGGSQERGMSRYADLKGKDKDLRQLAADMMVDPQAFVFAKKSKPKG